MIFTSSKFGHDISYYQDVNTTPQGVNFQKMRDNGASFVICRTSYGNNKDEDTTTNLTNSRGILPRGVYHYWWNSVAPLTQAQICLAAIAGQAIEGRVWLDLETIGAGTYNRPANWRAFCEAIEAAGYRVGVYTGYPWWKNNAIPTGEDLSYFYARPLWQAWYTTNAADVIVAGTWGRMMIWQDTSLYNGQNAGVESTAIDRNKWNDAYDFATEWGTVTPPPNGEPMTYGKAQEIKGNVPSVRLAPDVSGQKVGSLTAGVIVDFMELVPGSLKPADRWLKLPNGIHYVNQNVAGVELFKILSMPTTEPPPLVVDSITIDIAVSDVKTAGDRYEVKGVKAVKVA